MATLRPIVLYTQKNCRGISTSSVLNGTRNFRKIVLHQRGSRSFKERIAKNPDPGIPVHDYGVRMPGYTHNGKFHLIPEMIPEIVVPDLTGFKLKPYVSYRVDEVVQSEFTAKNLFDAVYSEKITKDFENGKLDADGNPTEPNEFEKMTAEEAKIKARKTGCDYFDSPVIPYIEGKRE